MESGFSKKEEFVFVGNRPYLRMDEEMVLINKEEADHAFKKCKKEIIDPLLLSNGFSKWKTNAYVKRNKIGLLEFIDLQKERYGSKTFCVNFSAMPLYCGYSYLVSSLGYRLGTYISAGKDIWWDYCNERIARQSFQNVAKAITQFILPWFFQLSSEEGYQKILTDLMENNQETATEWLEALKIENKEQQIQTSINQLKLPKKLLKQ